MNQTFSKNREEVRDSRWGNLTFSIVTRCSSLIKIAIFSGFS